MENRKNRIDDADINEINQVKDYIDEEVFIEIINEITEGIKKYKENPLPLEDLLKLITEKSEELDNYLPRSEEE